MRRMLPRNGMLVQWPVAPSPRGLSHPSRAARCSGGIGRGLPTSCALQLRHEAEQEADDGGKRKGGKKKASKAPGGQAIVAEPKKKKKVKTEDDVDTPSGL